MSHPVMKILGVVLPIAIFLIPIQVLAQEQSKDFQTSGANEELSVAAPDLDEIIPLATILSSTIYSLPLLVPNHDKTVQYSAWAGKRQNNSGKADFRANKPVFWLLSCA